MASSKHLNLLIVIGLLIKLSHQACKTNGVDTGIVNEGFYNSWGNYRYRAVSKYVTFSLNCNNVNSIETTEDHSKIKWIAITKRTDSKISSAEFYNFKNLVSLYIKESNVNYIEPGAFNGTSNIIDLTLTDNKISKLSKGVFNSLPVLKTLDISNNFIEKIENDAFLGLKNLDSLSLSHNNISNITEVLNIRNNVKTLNLSHNEIEELISFRDFKHLNVLILNDNKIVKIPNGSLTNALISTLDLSSNLIRDIEEETFRNMTDLKLLNLALNELSDLKNRRLPVQVFRDNILLQHLNISGIGLNTIAVGTFTGLEKLKVLDLSHNNLTYLPKGIFHDSISSMIQLYINDNSFTNFEYEGITKLSTINFNENPWHCDTLSTLVHRVSSKSVIRGLSFNTTNILGIACSETVQQNASLNCNNTESIVDNTQEFEMEKYNQNYLNSTIEEYRDFLAEVRRDLESFYEEFSKSFLDIFKMACINSVHTNCSSKEEEESTVHQELIQSVVDRLNSDKDVLEEISKKFDVPQRLLSKSNEDEKEYSNYAPIIILLCVGVLLSLMLILLVLIFSTYLKLKLLKEFEKMQLPLLENMNL